jgi:hypothetical protein
VGVAVVVAVVVAEELVGLFWLVCPRLVVSD